jgi:hypothetical protein
MDDADRVLSQFSALLASALVVERGVLVNLQTAHSDRSFEVRVREKVYPFVAKVSLTENGFWGVQFDKWDELQTSGGDLVLLRSPGTGYLLRNPTLPRIAKKISRASTGWRINEGTIRAERFFRDVEEFVDMLLRGTP